MKFKINKYCLGKWEKNISDFVNNFLYLLGKWNKKFSKMIH